MKTKQDVSAERLEIGKGIYFLYNSYNDAVRRAMLRLKMRLSYRQLFQPLLENESMTQLQLVQKTGLKAPTISLTLRNMERDGIVIRTKQINDRREVHVQITDKGREMYSDFLKAVENIEKDMISGLSKSDMQTLIKLLEVITANVNKLN